MLKAEVFCGNELQDTETGTPQGGILSLMLANVALTALDNYCANQLDTISNKVVNPIIRYADDFVIICRTEQEAQVNKERWNGKAKQPKAITHFLPQKGTHCIISKANGLLGQEGLKS